jgi:hypothetical protein
MRSLTATLLAASAAAALLAAPAAAQAVTPAGVQMADSSHGAKGPKGDKGLQKGKPADAVSVTAPRGGEDAVLDTVNEVLRDILGIEDNSPVTAYPDRGLPPGLAKRSQLPPGLAKQLRETGQLPPGLQKRLTGDLAARLPGYDVELRAGDLFVVNQQDRQTAAIVEGITEIFRAASGAR